MSLENVEIVRRIHEGWARGDFSQVDAFDPDVEFETVPGVGHGIYHGLEEMACAWRDILRSYGRFRAEFEEIIDAGDKVVVLTAPVMRMRDSMAELRQETAVVWTLRDRRVTRLALYGNRADAYREAGIDPAGSDGPAALEPGVEGSTTPDVLEFARRTYEAMNQAVADGDVAAFVRQAYDPEIVMEMGALEGTIRGLDGVQHFIEGQAAIIEGLRADPEEVIALGDRLLIAFRLSGTARSTGLPFEVHYVHLVTMRAGKAVHIQLYTSKAKALEAIG